MDGWSNDVCDCVVEGIWFGSSVAAEYLDCFKQSLFFSPAIVIDLKSRALFRLFPSASLLVAHLGLNPDPNPNPNP